LDITHLIEPASLGSSPLMVRTDPVSDVIICKN